MVDIIDAIIRTRKTASEILTKSLNKIEGLSEKQLAEKILKEVRNYSEIFPEGYYSPPPSGIGILFDQKPFKRLRYDSLRNPEYWPSQDITLNNESVSMLYFSPVDRETNMLGDVGCTIYQGEDEEIKQHIKKCYDTILKIAQYTEVGMEFSQICKFASNLIKGELKMTKWTAANSDPNQSINLGHTVPGSFEKDLVFGNTFEEIKETIRISRIALIDTANFIIPETCAFTVESRLEDFDNPNLPIVHFHFIVCFRKGKKVILENYNDIFKTVGMDYMI